VLVALGLIGWGLRNEDPPLAGSPASASPNGGGSAPATPSASANAPGQPDGPSQNLLAAVGEWTVDPKDPLYSSSDDNTLSLHREGSQLQGLGPEGAALRFWDQGSAIAGEAADVDGKIWNLRWEWLEPGARARMTVSNGQDRHQVTLIRPSAALESASSPPSKGASLFEAHGDLNSDGALETVRVLGLSPAAEANSDVDKQIEIADAGGSVLFRSEVFQEPFRTDLDDMAENPDQKAGLHILQSAQGFPVIRVIFVCRSGNFVDFQFNGQTYEVVTTGN
jgi:hypothetical protein